MATAKLTDLENAAKEFSAASKILRNIKEELDTEIDAVKAKYSAAFADASKNAGEAYQMLLTLVEDSEELFLDKKSMSINNVKFGYRKKSGKIEIDNEEFTINKLQELFPENADLYLSKKISVSKKALDSLTAAELKKVGVNVIQDTSEAFVKLTDDEVQKLIDALVKESAKMAK